MRDEANLKPIFNSKSLSPSEKEVLIQLIRKYIDVFAWNYEEMLSLNPQVAMHCLNSNLEANLIKYQQQRFYPRYHGVHRVLRVRFQEARRF